MILHLGIKHKHLICLTLVVRKDKTSGAAGVEYRNQGTGPTSGLLMKMLSPDFNQSRSGAETIVVKSQQVLFDQKATLIIPMNIRPGMNGLHGASLSFHSPSESRTAWLLLGQFCRALFGPTIWQTFRMHNARIWNYHLATVHSLEC